MAKPPFRKAGTTSAEVMLKFKIRTVASILKFKIRAVAAI
jgi:hypothetical protein